MARTVEVSLNSIGGYIRVALEKNPCGNLNVIPSYCKAQRGAALHMFYLSHGFNRTIGSIIGRSGNYTVWDGQNEQASGFRTLTEATTYLVESWIAANLVTVDLAPVEAAIMDEVADRMDAALAQATIIPVCCECGEEIHGRVWSYVEGSPLCNDCDPLGIATAVDDAAPQSFGWVTSEHARAAFHALAREWANGGPFYGATHTTQPLFQAQAAFHLLATAETSTALALPAKVKMYQHCPTCGDPVTAHSRFTTQVPAIRDRGYFVESRKVADGAGVTYADNGFLGRFCRKHLALAQWLALPEGGDPNPDYTHMAEAHGRIMQEQQDLLEQVGMAGMEARGMANGRVPADQDAITALVDRLYSLAVSLRENLMYQEGAGNCLADLAEPDTDPYLDTEPVVDDSDPYGYGDDYIHQDYFEAHFEAHLELA